MKSQKQIQHLVYAFITVVITVHAFVFYSLYVVEGDALMQDTGTSSVFLLQWVRCHRLSLPLVPPGMLQSAFCLFLADVLCPAVRAFFHTQNFPQQHRRA